MVDNSTHCGHDSVMYRIRGMREQWLTKALTVAMTVMCRIRGMREQWSTTALTVAMTLSCTGLEE